MVYTKGKAISAAKQSHRYQFLLMSFHSSGYIQTFSYCCFQSPHCLLPGLSHQYPESGREYQRDQSSSCVRLRPDLSFRKIELIQIFNLVGDTLRINNLHIIGFCPGMPFCEVKIIQIKLLQAPEDVAKAVVAPTTKTNAKAQAKIEVFLNFIIASILSEIAFFPKWLHKADIPFLRSSILINISA